jgi:hypothetical protein
MHPVLAKAVYPLAELVAAVGLNEAQLSPNSELHQWCAQQVVEHLILTFQSSRGELERRLKSGGSPASSASLLQWILRVQVCTFGSMSAGVSTTLSLRPTRFVPQDGKALAERLLAEAEALDKDLSACRIAFGLRPCGYHAMYGPLRVEEWRVYHSVHIRHHQRQFEDAIRLARRRAAGMPQSTPQQDQVAPAADSDGQVLL